MVEIQFLTASHIIDLHEDLACDTPGILSQQLLESAVAAPRWYDKLHYQAAALFRSLAKNHAFVDGNKRVAVVAVKVFLELNGYKLAAKQSTILKFVLRVATEQNPKVAWIARWFYRYIAGYEDERTREDKLLRESRRTYANSAGRCILTYPLKNLPL